MAHLSDDDLRNLLGMAPKTYRFFGPNRCSCGGSVNKQGICYRCQTDHSQAIKAISLGPRPKSIARLSAQEIRARLAGLAGQSCHSCFYGELDQYGCCDVCDYVYTNYHNTI